MPISYCVPVCTKRDKRGNEAFKTLSRGNKLDLCYEEGCWVQFSINEGTRVCSRHFLEESLNGIL